MSTHPNQQHSQLFSTLGAVQSPRDLRNLAMAFQFAGGDDHSSAHRQSARAVVADQRHLQNSITHLLHKVSLDCLDRDHLGRSLTAMQESVKGIDSYLREWIDAEIYAESCPPGAIGLAQRVFNIPELLEEILSYLTMGELLAAQYINRQFRDAVNASTRLQRKLSLLPHSSPYFYAPFEEDEAPGFQFNSTVDDMYKFQTLSAEKKMASGQDNDPRVMQARFTVDLPRIGFRCRRMFVVQPPITKMIAIPHCCEGVWSRSTTKFRKSHRTISNRNGITIGDLLKAAKRLQKKHENCPIAPFHMHDLVDGRVRMQTAFQAAYTVRQEDPLLKIPESKDTEEDQEEDDGLVSEERRLSRIRVFYERKRVGKYPQPYRWVSRLMDIDSLLERRENPTF